MFKRWSLPTLFIYILALTFGSLSKVSGVPKLGFTFDDKIYHFLAYAILMLLLFSYLRTTTIKYKVLFSASIAVVYGIIIEVLQQAMTSYRTLRVIG